METAETRAKLANAIRDLQAKGDTATINRLVSAYKVKYKSQPVKTAREKTLDDVLSIDVKPTFSASANPLKAIPVMVGNLPSNAAQIGVEAVIKPAARIGKSIDVATDIYKNRGIVEGTKDIAAGFADTYKKVGEAIVNRGDKLDAIKKADELQKLQREQRDTLTENLVRARKEGRTADAKRIDGVLRNLVSDMNDTEKQFGTPESRSLDSINSGAKIAAFPQERPVDLAVGLYGNEGSTVSNIARSKAIRPVTEAVEGAALKFKPTNIVENAITKEVDGLLTATKGIQNNVKLAEVKNIDLRKNISDPAVFKGLKVEAGKVNPDEAISVIDSRIDTLLDAKRSVLPKLDEYVPKIKREVVRKRAIENIKDKTLPADEADVIEAINKQINALPEELSLEELDSIRARARKSARDAKGIQKRDSEYAAIENATRDTIFDATDNLPFDTNGEFAALNTYVKDMIGTKEFLDKTIRGQVMKGGRLGKYAFRTVGAVAGSQGGIFSSILGSEIGGVVSDILTNNRLGSNIKMTLIRNITDNPQILKEAQNFVKSANIYRPPALPAPSTPFRTTTYGNKPIILPKESGTTIEAREIQRFGTPKISRQNIPTNTTKSQVIESKLPQNGSNVKKKFVQKYKK